jgi:hypothetical protein
MEILIYDIECYPNYFLVCTYNIQTKQYNYYELSDNLLTDIIHNPSIILIGWNNHSYDDILLNYISANSSTSSNATGWNKQTHKPITTEHLYDLSSKIIEEDELSSYIKSLKYADKAYYSIDIKALLNPMPSLKKVQVRIKFHNVQDLPIEPGTVLTDEQKKKIAIYCKNDVDATYDIYSNHAIGHIKLRQYLAQRFQLDVTRLESASEAQTAEYVLSTLATKHTILKPWEIKKTLQVKYTINNNKRNKVHLKNCIAPWIKFESSYLNTVLDKLYTIELPINPDTGYISPYHQPIHIYNKYYKIGIGGLHSMDNKLTLTNENSNLIEADVFSYYPSLLIRDQLYPQGYTKEWIHKYHNIFTAREQSALNPDQKLETQALKIILNAVFGKLGSKYSSFYDPTLLLRITLTGQLALLMLIEQCGSHTIHTISANTDGVLFNLLDFHTPKFYKICNEWEKQTKLKLNFKEFKAYSRRDVNNYTAVDINNKIKNKGIFLEPDIFHDVRAPIIARMARECLLFNIKPEDYILKHQHKFTIYDFLFSYSSTSKFLVKLHNNTKTINAPKTNRWYICKNYNNHLCKHGGKLNNTIKIPHGQNIVITNKITSTNVPNDLDLNYYINQAKRLIQECCHDSAKRML